MQYITLEISERYANNANVPGTGICIEIDLIVSFIFADFETALKGDIDNLFYHILSFSLMCNFSKYFQSSLQPMLMHKRMCRYVGPVVFLAILLNITKFFEAYIVHTEKGEISLRVSSMRKDPLYSAISKWTRLFILGLFPFCIILYLNFKIYMKLSQRATDRRSIYENGRLPTTIGDQVCIMGNHVSRGTDVSTKPEIYGRTGTPILPSSALTVHTNSLRI